MPAPKTPNTAAATAAVRRRGDETAAARLREHGWLVISPERLADLPSGILEFIAGADEQLAKGVDDMGLCDNCQRRNAVREAPDSSGIPGNVCTSCFRLPDWERSYHP